MTNERHIRPADYPDASQVKVLIDELENKVLDPAAFDSIFKEYLDDTLSRMFVAAMNDEIVGFISCRGHRLLHHEGLVFEIQELIVTSAQQGKGIGRALVNVLQDEVCQLGAKSLEVTSNKRRKEAHAFYQTVGFRNSHEKFTIYF